MEGELTLITKVIWGMLGSPNPDKCIERSIKEEKEHVKAMLSIIGFRVLSQTFEYNAEWGLLITRAEMIKSEKFYEPKIIKLKGKQYLDISGIDTNKLKNDD